MIDVQRQHSIRIDPPPGKSAHIWAEVVAPYCRNAVGDVPVQGGTVWANFLADSGNGTPTINVDEYGIDHFQLTPPTTLSGAKTLEDFVVHEPGTLWLISQNGPVKRITSSHYSVNYLERFCHVQVYLDYL